MKIRSATLEYQGQVFTFTSKPVFGATGAWVLEDVTGWYGGVGVRAETTDRLGHGMFQQRAWRSNRALTLAATYIANDPDERLALQRALSGMLWAGDYGTLTVETDRVLSCPVRLDGEPGIVELGTHGVQLQVPLVSMDPWLYGEDRVTYLYPQGTGVGLEYPLFTSEAVPDGVLAYGSAIDTNDRITNGGNAVAYPTYLVVGDFPGGVTIAVSGGSITFPWPISENAPLRVDTSGSAWIGGTNVTTRLTSRAFSKFAIKPGSTTAPKVTALQGGEGFVEMHISDTFI